MTGDLGNGIGELDHHDERDEVSDTDIDGDLGGPLPQADAPEEPSPPREPPADEHEGEDR